MNEKVCYIWLQQAVGPYSRLAREVLSRFENITDVYDCDDFEFLGEKRERYIKRLETKDMTEAFEVYKRCESMGVEITGYYSELYPKRLRCGFGRRRGGRSCRLCRQRLHAGH